LSPIKLSPRKTLGKNVPEKTAIKENVSPEVVRLKNHLIFLCFPILGSFPRRARGQFFGGGAIWSGIFSEAIFWIPNSF